MSYPAQAALVHLPGPGQAVAIPNGSSSTEVDLSAYLGMRVRVHATVLSYIRAGVTGLDAATTDDAALPANTPEVFYVSRGRTHIRVYGSALGTLSIAPVEG